MNVSSSYTHSECCLYARSSGFDVELRSADSSPLPPAAVCLAHIIFLCFYYTLDVEGDGATNRVTVASCRVFVWMDRMEWNGYIGEPVPPKQWRIINLGPRGGLCG